jgi:hypothetical protein
MFIDLFSRSSGAQDRSSRPEVRNPLLGLPSAARALEMPDAARDWLIEFLGDIRSDALVKAVKSWESYKAPSAMYWRIVAVYAGHIAKVLRKVAEMKDSQGQK